MARASCSRVCVKGVLPADSVVVGGWCVAVVVGSVVCCVGEVFVVVAVSVAESAAGTEIRAREEGSLRPGGADKPRYFVGLLHWALCRLSKLTGSRF